VVVYFIVFLVQILLNLVGRWSCNDETFSYVLHKNIQLCRRHCLCLFMVIQTQHCVFG